MRDRTPRTTPTAIAMVFLALDPLDEEGDGADSAEVDVRASFDEEVGLASAATDEEEEQQRYMDPADLIRRR